MNKCKTRLGFSNHNYGRYEIIKDADIGSNGVVIGRGIYQRRSCIDCHFTQYVYDEIGIGLDKHIVTKEI